MGQHFGTIALASASLVGIVGGSAWLVVLARADGADSTTTLASGETVTIEYEAHDPHEFTHDERAAIAEVAAHAIPDVHRALPAMPATIELHVGSAPRDAVIPETGENGSNGLPNLIFWRVDPSRPGGIAAVARHELRATLFHELHHLVRSEAIVDRDVVGDAVREGLATAFERDFAGVQAPWGQYPSDVDEWTRELLALPPDTPRDKWLRQRPDGRRWFGMRVGTYLVDRAMHASAKTSADFVQEPTEDIVALALGTDVGGREVGPSRFPCGRIRTK